MTEPRSQSGTTRQCPYCKALIDEAYIEMNPFPEIPCPSCNVLIPMTGTGSSEASDKRTERRCPVSLKVSYKNYDEFIEEYTRNVSKRGMFIHTKHSHRVGETAEIMLHVPGLDEPIKIIGEIRHVETEAAREEDRGIGLQFINIDEQSRQALIRFITSQDSCS